MKKLSLQNISHTSVIAAIATLLFVALYVFGIWYVRHLERAVRAQAEELAFETKRENSLRNLGSFLEGLSADKTRLASFFVPPEAAVTMIERVEDLGGSVGAVVSIGGVEIKDKNQETGEGTMVMNISSTGTWSEMNNLLTLLGTFPFASRVETATFSQIGSGGEDSAPAWSLRSTVHITLRR